MPTKQTSILLGASVMLAAVGGWLVHELPSPRRMTAPTTRADASVTPTPPAPLGPPPPTARSLARQVAAREVPAIVTVRDLDRYLDDLEVRARRNGQVTALEVLPGLAAIQRLAPAMGGTAAERTEEFNRRMGALSRELRARERAAPAPDADTIARRIEVAGPGERDALNVRLVDALARLDPSARAQAIERIAPLVGAAATHQP